MSTTSDGPQGRRFLVYWVSLFCGFSALGMIYRTLFPTTGTDGSVFGELLMPWWLSNLAGASLILAFAVALFQLRSLAVRLWEILIALYLAVIVHDLYHLGLGVRVLNDSNAQLVLATLVLGLGLLVAIYLYVRRLRTSGVLT